MANHTGLILAAGASTRMGRDKASLPWGETTLLSYQVAQMAAAGIQPFVVRGAGQPIPEDVAPARIVCNPQPERGKTSSIRAGLTALPADFTTLTIVAVDQPRPASVYQALLACQAVTGAALVAPRYRHRLGHPLLLSAALRAELAGLTEAAQGLRQVVRQQAAALVPVPWEQSLVLCDLNTPEDYRHWRDRLAEFC